ncbi:MAG TPA: hypothetical protein DD381_12240 [Lentisphaeria bacterium]|nr:MAG: hypothetical protein A2X47_09495 [Lentisphaerae bacterium GWF2_38_69]HBM17095.1 hypothetical protein [Lentisphaeria bacterium]
MSSTNSPYYIKVVSLLLIFFILFSLKAAEYMAIVDAGSSGTRVYFYKLTQKNSLPQVEEIKLENNTLEPSVLAYIKWPKELSDYLDSLFKSLITVSSERGIKTEDIEVYVLATAGLRIVSPKEREIFYTCLTDYIKNKKFAFAYAGMITGHMEGIFDWVAVNYLLNTFSEDKKSVGVLDLGGGSTQIAFETQEVSIFESKIKIGNKTYNLYSRSYLGIGMDYARYQFSNHPECWPKGYPMPSTHIKADPDFSEGVRDFSMLINLFHNLNGYKDLNPPDDMDFIGIRGYYHVANAKALHLNSTFTLKELQQAGTNFSKLSWQELEKNYPDDPYLFAHLIHLQLITALFKYEYDFHSDKEIQTCNKINGTAVSLALGAAIYFYEGNRFKN